MFWSIYNLQLEVLLDQAAGNGVVEVLVLGKGLDGELLVGLEQGAVQRAHKLHAADGTKQLGGAVRSSGVTSTQGNAVVGSLDLDVLGRDEVVDSTQLGSSLGRQGAVLVELAEENKLLVTREVLDVGGLWLIGLDSISEGHSLGRC